MAKVIVHQHREFLNLAGYGMDGNIVASSISYDSEDAHTDGRYPEVTFLIRGCDRTYVELDFSMDLEEYENGLYKIDTLITALKKFRKAYVKEAPRMQKARAKWHKTRAKSSGII